MNVRVYECTSMVLRTAKSRSIIEVPSTSDFRCVHIAQVHLCPMSLKDSKCTSLPQYLSTSAYYNNQERLSAFLACSSFHCPTACCECFVLLASCMFALLIGNLDVAMSLPSAVCHLPSAEGIVHSAQYTVHRLLCMN
uniref:Uncharacterized protein n=1 Tax=Palpitomonas bilix TaxID=652834 RepID=A0A7S3LW23_9EUKA